MVRTKVLVTFIFVNFIYKRIIFILLLVIWYVTNKNGSYKLNCMKNFSLNRQHFYKKECLINICLYKIVYIRNFLESGNISNRYSFDNVLEQLLFCSLKIQNETWWFFLSHSLWNHNTLIEFKLHNLCNFFYNCLSIITKNSIDFNLNLTVQLKKNPIIRFLLQR